MTSDQRAEPSPVAGARSFLFVPGDRPDRFDKACAAGPDVVILDLEDAVAAGERAAARGAVVAWLAGRTETSPPVAVRVNAAGTPDHDADLDALAVVPTGGLGAVVVAKAEDPAALARVARTTSAPVVALVETAVGVLRAPEIAAVPEVVRLALGHLDLAADLGADPSRPAMLHTRSALVLASRAAGLAGPVDGVTTALDDPEVLSADLAHARELGLTGKLLIHPGQVAVTHEAYRPTEAEVEHARRVLAAVAEHGTGAVRVDGEMVDPPVVRRAEEILRREER